MNYSDSKKTLIRLPIASLPIKEAILSFAPFSGTLAPSWSKIDNNSFSSSSIPSGSQRASSGNSFISGFDGVKAILVAFAKYSKSLDGRDTRSRDSR